MNATNQKSLIPADGYHLDIFEESDTAFIFLKQGAFGKELAHVYRQEGQSYDDFKATAEKVFNALKG